MDKVRKVRKLPNGSQKSRNSEVLKSFVQYCESNPEQRFWQALRNWSGKNFILVARHLPPIQIDVQDTFFWETKNG